MTVQLAVTSDVLISSQPACVAMAAEGRGSSPYSIRGGSGPYAFASVEAQVDGRRHTTQQVGRTENAATVVFMDGHTKLTNIALSVRRPGNIWTARDDD